MPTHALSRLTYHVARARAPWFKDRLNRFFAERYALDLTQSELDDPCAYSSLNALFTRALRPGARPLPDDPTAIISPCDGTISAIGTLSAGRMIQAKGIDYAASELLGALYDECFADGHFATIYLSPHDYHRFHAPIGGRLRCTQQIPGRLLTVAPPAVRSIRGLFLRNERLVTRWQTALGPVALVAVGAVNVGSITTVWSEEGTPLPRGQLRHYGENGPAFERGAEIGRFNLGSTIIVLFPAGSITWTDGLNSGDRIRMGEWLGTHPGGTA
ncbi:phosphatidylserine decarboxylase [Halorhodospira abdelmalekii]|nr:phosphatidylserine decarboxylase [Halorhodospira abdelmalekii]